MRTSAPARLQGPGASAVSPGVEREGDHPSGPEAREPLRDLRRPCQDSRLRPGPAALAPLRRPDALADRRAGDRAGHRPRDRRLYGRPSSSAAADARCVVLDLPLRGLASRLKRVAVNLEDLGRLWVRNDLHGEPNERSEACRHRHRESTFRLDVLVPTSRGETGVKCGGVDKVSLCLWDYCRCKLRGTWLGFSREAQDRGLIFGETILQE